VGVVADKFSKDILIDMNFILITENTPHEVATALDMSLHTN
jgi:hypothetical protein